MKTLFTLILTSLSISLFAQIEKTYNHGTIFWGTFDSEKQNVIGELEKYADILQLKKVDYDYYIYAIGIKGEKFRFKFSKIRDFEMNNKYIDETGAEYLIHERGNTLLMICLKPLPNMVNKFMMLKIVDIY